MRRRVHSDAARQYNRRGNSSKLGASGKVNLQHIIVLLSTQAPSPAQPSKQAAAPHTLVTTRHVHQQQPRSSHHTSRIHLSRRQHQRRVGRAGTDSSTATKNLPLRLEPHGRVTHRTCPAAAACALPRPCSAAARRVRVRQSTRNSGRWSP